jgi:two-component sensor histidine kinase
VQDRHEPLVGSEDALHRVVLLADHGRSPLLGHKAIDPEHDKGLGLSIVDTLTCQDLRGALDLGSNAAGGTTITLRFPLSVGAQQTPA